MRILARTTLYTRRAVATKEEVGPIQYLIATANAWSGNPPKDAIYLNAAPSKNDFKTRVREW